MLLQHILQASLQEATTRTLTRCITNNHLQSLVQKIPQIPTTYTTNLLHYSNTITSTTITTTTTSPLIVYSRDY